MKALVVYDSAYGNTEAIARAIGEALGGDATVLRVGEADPKDRRDLDLLVVGSPTQAGRPTNEIKAFLGRIPKTDLRGIDAAAFDTRIPAGERGFGMRLFMGMIGYAAPRIAKELGAKGANLRGRPEGFIVEDTEGPLREGELARAAAWAERIPRRAASAAR